jgi:hypothetical protein
MKKCACSVAARGARMPDEVRDAVVVTFGQGEAYWTLAFSTVLIRQRQDQEVFLR